MVPFGLSKSSITNRRPFGLNYDSPHRLAFTLGHELGHSQRMSEGFRLSSMPSPDNDNWTDLEEYVNITGITQLRRTQRVKGGERRSSNERLSRRPGWPKMISAENGTRICEPLIVDLKSWVKRGPIHPLRGVIAGQALEARSVP